MAWPTIAIEFDLSNGPLTSNSANTWTDRTVDVLSFTIARGRQDELSRIEAGTATITLDNTDRLYNPFTNPDSANLSGIQPMRKARISATYSGTTYRLFTGYVEAWPPEYDKAIDAVMTLRCVDAFKYFSLKKLNGAYVSEIIDASFEHTLDAIGWPDVGADDRDIFAANSTIQAGTWVNTPALTHFRNLEAAESGLFFIAGDGRPTFHHRHKRSIFNLSPAATFSDAIGTTDLPMLGFTSKYDDTYIWNEARITRTGGIEQVATDATSQAAYFSRTYTATLPIENDAEALGLAQYIVSRYANPAFRFTTITVDGAMDDDLWPAILGLVISDRITIVSNVADPYGLPAGSGLITQDCYIEGIAHAVDGEAGRWTTVFQLSPAETQMYWILGSSLWGVLGTTTRLGY